MKDGSVSRVIRVMNLIQRNREANVAEDHEGVRLFWIHGSTVPREHDLGENVMGWEPVTAERMKAVKAERQKLYSPNHKGGFAEVGWVLGLRVKEELSELSHRHASEQTAVRAASMDAIESADPYKRQTVAWNRQAAPDGSFRLVAW